MNKTRYFKKKNDGVYFASCPKDDQDDTVQDGRKWRHWTFGEKEGKTLGYEESELAGLIESAYINDFNGEESINIGMQTNEGVVVLQVQIDGKWGMTKDILSISKKLRNIDLQKDVCFGAWLNSKGAYKTQHGNTITPCYLTVQQFNGVKGVSVEGTFPYIEGEGYDGLPAPEVKSVRGKETKDFSARDEILYKELTDFCARVEKECKGRKDARPNTPAEDLNAQIPEVAGNVEESEDLPF